MPGRKSSIETQIVGNSGMYYVCYQLSMRGWNVMPTARNARGIDVIAYAPDGSGYLGIQVKTLSYRNAVPIGKSLDKILGDLWIVVVLSNPESPDVFILTPDEIKALSHPSGKEGKISYWMEYKAYSTPEFKSMWCKVDLPPEKTK